MRTQESNQHTDVEVGRPARGLMAVKRRRRTDHSVLFLRVLDSFATCPGAVSYGRRDSNPQHSAFEAEPKTRLVVRVRHFNVMLRTGVTDGVRTRTNGDTVRHATVTLRPPVGTEGIQPPLAGPAQPCDVHYVPEDGLTTHQLHMIRYSIVSDR